jgi:hypothetical protein
MIRNQMSSDLLVRSSASIIKIRQRSASQNYDNRFDKLRNSFIACKSPQTQRRRLALTKQLASAAGRSVRDDHSGNNH